MKRACSSLQALFVVRRKVTFVVIINFDEIIVILQNLCYNEYALKRSTTFTYLFVSKHRSHLDCETETVSLLQVNNHFFETPILQKN